MSAARSSKRRRPTPGESERNVQQFLDNLDNESFIGNEFIGDEEDLEPHSPGDAEDVDFHADDAALGDDEETDAAADDEAAAPLPPRKFQESR